MNWVGVYIVPKEVSNLIGTRNLGYGGIEVKAVAGIGVAAQVGRPAVGDKRQISFPLFLKTKS